MGDAGPEGGGWGVAEGVGVGFVAGSEGEEVLVGGLGVGEGRGGGVGVGGE